MFFLSILKYRFESEVQLESELHQSRIGNGSEDLPEAGAGDIRNRSTEVNIVEKVENLPAEFEISPLGDIGSL